MHFKLFLLNIGEQFIHAYDTGVCGLCHGVLIQRTVQVQVWILEELENIPLHLGKYKTLRNTLKLRLKRRGNRETRRLRKGTIATRI